MADIYQKEIYLANLDPTEGSEQGGKRPVVVISGETTNAVFPIVLTCPLTTTIKKFESCPVIHKNSVNGLSADSQALVFQVRALSKSRFIRKIGAISDDELDAIHQGMINVLRY